MQAGSDTRCSNWVSRLTVLRVGLLPNICLCTRSFISIRKPAVPNHGTKITRYRTIMVGPIVIFGILLATKSAIAETTPESISVTELSRMSLEDLTSIEITSVSKKPERLADAAASVFVITAEDIRRSGVTSLPEALRLAPNLQVAQVSASGYAISARGMNGSNVAPDKLLVMIDGRSVYTPLFSGVFWDAQDVMLDDVERIEVISGPGGTLWGVNAVNGVINVITRSAKNTQGGLATLGSGNTEDNSALRYGGTIGADGNYRIYGKYSDHDNTRTGDGSTVNDAWHKSQAGFRADWDRSGDKFMVQGNAYDDGEGQPAPGAIVLSGVNFALAPVSLSGVNVTTHWEHLLDGGSSMSVQAYYDHTARNIPPIFAENLDITDVQFQHSLQPVGMHTLVWGANYRYGMDRVNNANPYFVFLPANVNQTWSSLFAQDVMALRQDVRLTAGARIERNDYTGNELLPNVRLAWKLSTEHMLWSAASRAVRAPSRLDHDAYVPATPPFLLDGGNNVQSEVSNVYELGYRGQPAPSASYSVTIFHNVYQHLRTQEIDPSSTFLVFASEMKGTASGIEAWGTYQVSPEWRLSPGFTALKEKLELTPSSNDTAAPDAVGNDPAYAWHLRSTLNISSHHELDADIRHVAELANNAVPAYTVVDARISWGLPHNLELSMTARNLFNNKHAEYGPAASRSEFGRSVFIKASQQF